jgi:hypothetical protein
MAGFREIAHADRISGVAAAIGMERSGNHLLAGPTELNTIADVM